MSDLYICPMSMFCKSTNHSCAHGKVHLHDMDSNYECEVIGSVHSCNFTNFYDSIYHKNIHGCRLFELEEWDINCVPVEGGSHE